MYYYITPSFSLASLQDRIELDNHLTNNTTTPPDYVNTQVWELTFSDPTKKLGPMRNLNVQTGYENIAETENPNTANMQYKNVLFYKGIFLDYNHNLHVGDGSYARDRVGDKVLHFWRVATDEGDVYIGVTNYPEAKAGIIEVVRSQDYESYDSFKTAVRNAPSSCQDTGKKTSYTSAKGDEIRYNNSTGEPGDGSATVNSRWSIPTVSR